MILGLKAMHLNHILSTVRKLLDKFFQTTRFIVIPKLDEINVPSATIIEHGWRKPYSSGLNSPQNSL